MQASAVLVPNPLPLLHPVVLEKPLGPNIDPGSQSVIVASKLNVPPGTTVPLDTPLIEGTATTVINCSSVPLQILASVTVTLYVVVVVGLGLAV